jgi:hypothetical protein
MKPDSDLTSGSVHPFRAFWETRDLGVWIDALEPNVELHSPAVTTPFRGREVAADLYGVLLETLDDFEIVEELAAGDAYACLWRANVGGRRIEGADFIRSNLGGKIAEVRALIRPLVGISAFASGVGPPLAAKRGRLRAVIVRVFSFPLRILFALVDSVFPRLVLRGRA